LTGFHECFRSRWRAVLVSTHSATAPRFVLWVPGLIVTVMLGSSLPLPALAASSRLEKAKCDLEGSLVRNPELPEASGIAASRRTPGRFWSLNDSGKPVVFLLDGRGAVMRRLDVVGATVVDWEAIAVGQCAAGSCLYIADIGDNDGQRTEIRIYRLPEPLGREQSVMAEVFYGYYPDHPQDAETLLVTADEQLYIVRKGTSGPSAVYRFPRHVRSGQTVRLDRVGRTRSSGKADAKEWITDGAISPDGQRVVLRTHDTLLVYSSAQFLSGEWDGGQTFNIADLGEPQGEGVAFGAEGVIHVTSEGGGKDRPGTFGTVRCPRRQ
jgi:hypothetical protein